MVKRIFRHKAFIWISIPIAIIAVLMISVTLFMHSVLFKNQAANLISEYLFRDDGCRLILGEVSGNPFANLTIRDLAIRYESETHSYDIVKVDQITVEYSIFSLLGDVFTITSAEFVNPHIWIKAASSGPGGTPEESGITGSMMDVRIDRFSVHDGQVIYQSPEKADAVKSIDLKGMLSAGDNRIEAGIITGSGSFITRDLKLRDMRGRVAYDSSGKTGENSLFFENYMLGTGSSRLILNGKVSVDSLNMDMDVKASPLNLDELSRALESGQKELGRLNGSFTLKGHPGDLRLRGQFDGEVKNYSFSEFKASVHIKEGDFEIGGFEGGLNGARVDGKGGYKSDSGIFKLSFQGKEVDLSREFYPGAPLPETDFNGRMDVLYRFDSKELSLDFYLGDGHFRRIPFENAVISADYRNDSLVISEMLARSCTHEIKMRGSIVGRDTIRLLLDVQSEPSDTLFSYFNIEDYRAYMDVRGIWKGTFDNWDLRLSGNCRNLDYRRAAVPEGRIQLAVEKRDDYRVFFDITADTCFIDRYRFRDMDLSLEYAMGNVNIKRLNLAKSDVEAELRGKYRAGNGESELVLNDATLRMFNEDWVSSGEFSIFFRDSDVVFNDMQMHSRIGAIYFDGELKRFRNHFDGRLRFERIDMSVLNINEFIPMPVEGSAAGIIESSGSLAEPDLSVSFNLKEGVIDDIPVEKFDLKAVYSGNHCRLDTLSLSSPVGFAFASGDIENLDMEALYRNGSEALEETESDLEIYCGQLSISPFIDYFPGIPFAEGTFTGRALVAGSLIHPGIRMEGTGREIALSHIKLPRLDIRADLDSTGIRLDGEIYAAENRKQGEYSGVLPLNEEKWLYSLDRTRDLTFDLEIADMDLSDFADMSDLVARAEGTGSLEFAVRGNAGNPYLSGDLRLNGAGFRLAGMEERFRKVNAWVSFEDTLVKVRYLNGQEGRQGKFASSGTVSLKGWNPEEYDLTVDMEKFMVTSISDVAAIVTGRLKIGTETYEGRKIPFLQGRLEVNEAEVYFNPAEMEDTGGNGGIVAPEWMAELDLDMKGNTRIVNPDANIEFMGKVTLHHNEMGTYLRGELELYRGWYNLYNNKFHIQSGRLLFSHAGGNRPLIDIEAVTYDQEGKRIYLTLVWDENDPQPRLSLHHEESGYSETDIWKMLGGGIVGSPRGADSEWSAMRTAQSLAANYLERVLNSQMEGFTVSLEQGNVRQSGAIGGEKETMLAIGKYLSEGLYVQWKQGLSVATETEVEVEYRISDLFLIRTEVIKYSKELLPGESMRSGDEINLDVKIRWEF